MLDPRMGGVMLVRALKTSPQIFQWKLSLGAYMIFYSVGPSISWQKGRGTEIFEVCWRWASKNVHPDFPFASGPQQVFVNSPL